MNRPLLTFALITYNQEAFVRDAVRSVFLQDYSPLEIIITDDCSPDSTFAILQSEVDNYTGPHVIRLHRNKKNLGIGGQVNQVMRMAKGELVVIGAGDDISLPFRTTVTYEKWIASAKKAKSIFSKGLIIDEHGNETGVWEPPYPVNPESYSAEAIALLDLPILGAAHAWSREVFDVFGEILAPVMQEDLVIPFRSSLLGEISYIAKPLVRYRKHSQSTWKNFGDYNNWRDYLGWQYRKSVNRISVYKNHLAALSILKESLPARYVKVANLRTVVERRLGDELEQINLFNVTSYLKRLNMFMSLILKNPNKRRLVTYFGQFIIPPIYFQYLQLKFKLGRF